MKEVKINEFQNFNQVIDVYRKCLNVFSSSYKNGFSKQKINELTDSKYGLSFAIITAINFSQALEYLDENDLLDEEKWNEIYYRKPLLRSRFSDIYAMFDDINVEGVSNSDKSLEGFKEKIHKIRNCLAHGRYHLVLSDSSTNTDLNHCYLEFDDPDHTVEGRIVFSDMRDFEPLIKEYFSDIDDSEYFIDQIHVNSRKPEVVLPSYIKKIYKKDDNKKYYLTQKELDKLRQYISLIGKKEGIQLLEEFMNVSPVELKKSIKNGHSIENLFKGAINARFYFEFSELLNLVINGGHSQFDKNLNSFLATIYMGYGKDLNETLDNTISVPLSDKNVEKFLLDILKGVSKGDYVNQKRKLLYFKKPILYTDTLMSMCNYMIGYIRESNINYDRNMFKFSNIDIGNIKITKEDPEEPSIREINLGEVVLNKKCEKEKEKETEKGRIKELLKKFTNPKRGEITNLLKFSERLSIDQYFHSKLVELKEFENNLKTSDLDNLNYLQTIEKLKEYNDFLKRNTDELLKFPEPMRNSLFENLTNLQQRFSKIIEINGKISSLEAEYDKVKDEPTYTDYSGLFGHIRNSIVHSNFSINYSLAAKSKNYEDIEFEFKDFKKGDPNWLTFQSKMKAKDLIYLLESLQKSITDQVNETDKNKKFEVLALHKALVELGISPNELNEYNIVNSIQQISGNKKGDIGDEPK